MILTGPEIKRQYELGDIFIDEFDESRLNPNSYNLRLDKMIAKYDQYGYYVPLDMKKENKLDYIMIPEDGYILKPGCLYLGRTMEYTETNGFVPMLEGRSSVGRLGINVHATAGFGDVGFKGYWTLEISVVQPVRIYAGIDICQIYYHTILGDIQDYGDGGKYQNNTGIQGSMMWKEFE